MPKTKKTPSKKGLLKAKSTKKLMSSVEVAKSEELLKHFYQVVTDLRTDEESKVFFLDFLTESERATFAKRLAVALELQSGKSYETIRKQFGVSSATISTVAEMMSSPGMKLALKKIQNDKWANEKSNMFIKFFGIK